MERNSLQRVVPLGLVLLLISSILFFSAACSVQKRHYRKGFYVYMKHNPESRRCSERNSPALNFPRSSQAVVSTFASVDNKKEEPSLLCHAGKKSDLPAVAAFNQLNPPEKVVERNYQLVSAYSFKQERGERRKLEWMGITAFLIAAGAWLALVVYPITLLQFALFAIAAGLAALSMTKMSRDPDRYVLKTLSFVALLLSLIGLAILIYAGVIYLLS